MQNKLTEHNPDQQRHREQQQDLHSARPAQPAGKSEKQHGEDRHQVGEGPAYAVGNCHRCGDAQGEAQRA